MAAKQHPLLTVILIMAMVATSCAETVTVYDILQKNNLPQALLPKGVQSYTLTPEGKVDVILPNACEFPVTVGGAKYTMRFGDRVGGLIKPGSVQEAHGVEVQVSYGWLGISQVDRVGDQIAISVQQGKPLQFPVSNFAVSPSCG